MPKAIPVLLTNKEGKTYRCRSMNLAAKAIGALVNTQVTISHIQYYINSNRSFMGFKINTNK